MIRTQSATPTKTRSGFALVIALSLMAFVLLLIVSMTLLVQVETQVSATGQSQLRAKESAKLALMMALGDLQKHAGPDQRVTARAEILGDNIADSQAKHWTGVWNTTRPSAAPQWLVSGNDPNPSSLAANNLMQLAGAGSTGTDPDNHVSAPVQTLSNESDSYAREIAWWISDEGVKASLGLTDNVDELAPEFFTDSFPSGLSAGEQRQILKQIGPRSHDLSVFFGSDLESTPSEIEDIRNPSVKASVLNAHEQIWRSYNKNHSSLYTGVESVELINSYHDLGFLSKAVHTDTERGGLKLDLMNRSFNDSSIDLKVDDRLRRFLWNSSPDSTGAIPIQGLSNTELNSLSDGDIVNTTPVIITEFALYFVVSGQSKSSNTARAFLRFEAEMWSPYGFRHQFNDASGSGDAELSIEIEGLPDIRLQYYDKESETVTSSSTLQFDDIDPTFDFNFSETHKAGELRKLTGQWPINASSDKGKFYYTRQWNWSVADPIYNPEHRSVSYPDGDSINYSASQSKVNLVVRNANGDIVQRVENIPFGSINADFAYYQSSPSSLSTSDAPIAFQYRLYDSREDIELWLTEMDPRSSTLDLENDMIAQAIDLNDADGDKSGDPDLPTIDAFSNLDFFHGQANNNFFRLYDVPATHPYSLGVLQHLQIKGVRPYSIGNQWGDEYNSAFDRYFISTIPQSGSASYWNYAQSNSNEAKLPNPHTLLTKKGKSQPISTLRSRDSAQFLLQAGSFNFNSTSQLAWESVLRANTIYNWNYIQNKGTSTEKVEHRLNLESSYFRLPFSGHIRSKSFSNWEFPFEAYEDETSVNDDYPFLSNAERTNIFKSGNLFNPNSEWKPSSSIGHRELSKAEIRVLANNIIAKLKDRSRPFISFKELINSGILQEAIDETTINTTDSNTTYIDAPTTDKMPRNATSFLSQADLISALSPGFSPRSDTFTIRAGARIRNLTTNTIEGTAYCEATVQRIPDRVGNHTLDQMSNATGLGRQFKLIQIRWLDSSQL